MLAYDLMIWSLARSVLAVSFVFSYLSWTSNFTSRKSQKEEAFMSLECGDGGFSWLARNWGECLTIHSPPALTLISLFRPGSVQSGRDSRDDCNRVFSMPGQRHSQPTPISLSTKLECIGVQNVYCKNPAPHFSRLTMFEFCTLYILFLFL